MEWIKVTDRLPEEGQLVLVTIRHSIPNISPVWADVKWTKYGGWKYLVNAWEDFWAPISNDDEVTHWMPYPTPAED